MQTSQAVRDFTIELSYSPFHPDDARLLRNLIQGVIRAILAIRTETILYDLDDIPISPSNDGDAIVQIQPAYQATVSSSQKDIDPAKTVCKLLSDPTRKMISVLETALFCADKSLLKISGHSHFSKSEAWCDIEEMLETINEYADFIVVQTKVKICRDLKDNFLLSLSIIFHKLE